MSGSAELEGTPATSAEPSTEETRVAWRWVWPVATLVATLVAALIPLVFLREYYYAADTSQGAYGIWYHLGMELRAGHWPMLNPDAWGSGNYLAEGQWGLYSPLIWLISIGASYASNVVVYASIVKIAFLLVASGGVYVLLRSFRVSQPLSMAGAVAAPLSGFTLYMDAPSWVTNLMVWALLPWVWWAMRRAFRGASPWPAILFAFTIVTIGYVHGTIMLFVLLLGLFIESCVRRSRRAIIVTLGLAVFTGLLAIVVYLPGVATAGVTIRDSTEITNSGFLVMDGTGLASAIIPTVQSQVIGWWGTFALGPITYMAWFLPLLVLVDVRRLRRLWPSAIPVLTMAVVAAAFVFGPSDVGPLRYPMRLTPFLTLALILITVMCLDRARRDSIGKRSIVAVLLIALVATYLAVAQFPTHWRIQVVAGVLVAGSLALTVFLFARARQWGEGVAVRRVGAVIAVVSVAFVGVQHHYFDGTQTSGSSDYPSHLADYQTQVPDGINDGIVVGDPGKIGSTDDIFSETDVANTWYMNPHVAMQNTYTTIFYAKYDHDVCMGHLGDTCPELLSRLFAVDGHTGAKLVDLLSIDTVQIIKKSVPADKRAEPPAGWHVVDDGKYTVTWVRDHPIGPAGRVAWSTPGLKTTEIDSSATEVRLRVDKVPQGGGQLVFSRLAWPGYTVQNASLSDPYRGYLVNVKVPESAAGQEIVLQFRPPFWNAELLALGLALVLGLALSIVGARNRWAIPRSTRSGTSSATDAAPSPGGDESDADDDVQPAAPGTGSAG